VGKICTGRRAPPWCVQSSLESHFHFNLVSALVTFLILLIKPLFGFLFYLYTSCFAIERRELSSHFYIPIYTCVFEVSAVKITYFHASTFSLQLPALSSFSIPAIQLFCKPLTFCLSAGKTSNTTCRRARNLFGTQVRIPALAH